MRGDHPKMHFQLYIVDTTVIGATKILQENAKLEEPRA